MADKRVQELEERLARSEARVTVLQKRLDHLQGERTPSGIAACAEQDFYPDERREVLLDVLKLARRGILDGTRRACIVDDFLLHNPARGEPERRRRLLKDALKGWRKLDGGVKKCLRQFGVSWHLHPSKHNKFYYGDMRFYVTAPSSGGDASRGGKNLAAQMIRQFF